MKKNLMGLLALGASVALVATGCSAGSSSTGTADSTLTVSVPYDSNSFDSADLQGGMELFWGPVYDTLLKHSKTNGDVVANAAKTFSYNTAKTQLTLVLRSGMKFSDGSPVTAAAVKATMLRLKAGSGASASYLSSVATIETPSTSTVKLDLSSQDPVLLDYLTQAAGVIANPKGFDKKDFNRVPEGSGPYTLDSAKSTQGVQYTFTKNDKYWDAASYPYTTIVTRVMSDQTARINALISGQLDYSLVDTSALPQAKKSGLALQTVLSGWVGLMLADRDGKVVPQLKDVRVRQAINYAFDRKAIVQKYFGGVGLPTETVFDVGSEAFNKKANTTYDYDPAKAKSLLAEAGYPNGFAVTMPTSPSSTFMDGVVKQSLADIGIKVTYVDMSDEQKTPVLLKATYGMFFFGDESQSAFYDIKKSVLPGAIWNPFHTTTPEVAKLAETARTATDPQVAHAAYQEMGKYLVDQAWYVPITKNPTNYVTSSAVKLTPTPHDPQIFPRNFTPVKK